MKHQKLLSGLILTGLLVLVCLSGSAAADEPVITISPTAGGVTDTVTLTATDTGYTSLQWKVSTDGGATFTDLSTENPYSYVPGAVGVYSYQAVFTYAEGDPQTVTAAQTVTIYATPEITVSPLRGNTTTEITLTADLSVYTAVQWKVSKDGGATFTNLSTENPYSYVPGEKREYQYQAVFTADEKEPVTITYDNKIVIMDWPLPDTAPISTTAFYFAAIFFVMLFMFGLYFVYNDNIFGFIASGFAVLCSWALMALSAFGRVGDTYVFFNITDTNREIIRQVLFIDPSMVYMLTFACIIMTIVFIIILARFLAQLALLRQRDPEEEEEEAQ